MNHFSEEILAKARKIKSVEELISLAKENDIPLTREQAQEYYTQLTPKSGELADEELDNVGGGCDRRYTIENGYISEWKNYVCNYWRCKNCSSTKSKVQDNGMQGRYVCEGCNAYYNCTTCYLYSSFSCGCRRSYHPMPISEM